MCSYFSPHKILMPVKTRKSKNLEPAADPPSSERLPSHPEGEPVARSTHRGSSSSLLIPEAVLKQLAQDIEKAGGLDKISQKSATVGQTTLYSILQNRQHVYGARGSELRGLLSDKVAKWKVSLKRGTYTDRVLNRYGVESFANAKLRKENKKKKKKKGKGCVDSSSSSGSSVQSVADSHHSEDIPTEQFGKLKLSAVSSQENKDHRDFVGSPPPVSSKKEKEPVIQDATAFAGSPPVINTPKVRFSTTPREESYHLNSPTMTTPPKRLAIPAGASKCRQADSEIITSIVLTYCSLSLLFRCD